MGAWAGWIWDPGMEAGDHQAAAAAAGADLIQGAAVWSHRERRDQGGRGCWGQHRWLCATEAVERQGTKVLAPAQRCSHHQHPLPWFVAPAGTVCLLGRRKTLRIQGIEGQRARSWGRSILPWLPRSQRSHQHSCRLQRFPWKHIYLPGEEQQFAVFVYSDSVMAARSALSTDTKGLFPH